MEYRETIGNVVLNTEDYPGRDLYSDGEIEDVLLDIAKNTDPKDFDKVVGRGRAGRSCIISPRSGPIS